jgi:hypothetical protein
MVEHRPLWGIDDWQLVQGPAGHLLHDRFREALKHWYATPERIQDTTGDMDEDIAYEPVPARRRYTVRVKYRSIGQGQPLPYTLEE